MAEPRAAFASIKGILIAGVITASCGTATFQGFSERFSYDPQAAECMGLQRPVEGTWLRLSGCRAEMLNAVTSRTKRRLAPRSKGVLNSVIVPLQTDDSGEPWLVLEAKDGVVIEAVSQLDAVDLSDVVDGGSFKALEKIVAFNHLELPPFEARVGGRPGSELMKALGDSVKRPVLIRATSGSQPGLVMPIVALIGTLFWCLITLSAVISMLRGPNPTEITD